MTRIVYVNGRYLPYAQAARACGGPRLPVRRCRLRGVRGQGRPAGRRDAAYAAPGPLADRARHAPADVAAAPVAGDARDDPAQPRARRHRLPAGVARRRPARLPVSARPMLPTVVCLARSVSPAPARGGGRSRHRRQDHARHPLGPLRHQDGDAAAGRARQGERRARRAPRKPGSSTPRATSPRAPHPTPGSSTSEGRLITRQIDKRHPARRHAHDADRSAASARISSWSSGRSPSRRPRPRARPSSPRRPISSCRWCASTASPSATAHRAC